MENREYFGTDDQQKAKNWDMLKQGQEYRANLSRIRNEIRQRAASIHKFADAIETWESHAIRFDDQSITVLRQDPPPHLVGRTIRSELVASIPSSACDLDEIRCLLINGAESKKALAQITQELADLGIPF